MPDRSSGEASAGETFERGLAAFRRGDLSAAHADFERVHRREPRDPRYMSWYGLTLVLVEKNSNLGVLLCDQALRAGQGPDLFLNQARVHFALNQRERTVRALQRGLELHPEDPGLLQARDALGWRRRPVLPFLSRRAPLNRLLGRLRYRFSGSDPGAGAGPTPATLGTILLLQHPVTGTGAAPAEPEPDPHREP
jgi:tetratricopeptide (TPR) repeat protein